MRKHPGDPFYQTGKALLVAFEFADFAPLLISLGRDAFEQFRMLGFFLFQIFFVLDLLRLDGTDFQALFAAFARERTPALDIHTQRIDVSQTGAGEIAVITQVACDFVGVLLVKQ